EGVIGGIIGAGLLGFLYGHFMMPGIKWPLALIAAIGGVIAQIGDLAASAIKRDKNIKDYGRCIPGHGGVMDRFDSSIFTAPIIYLLAVLWLSTMK
ncbi:MAG: phosphatidate cytidylyltransferase, partial [Lachnospiraceae bacterium]|nr:phosphatidate cytidylyltransferase [Lachnospiraceae bacterium]